MSALVTCRCTCVKTVVSKKSKKQDEHVRLVSPVSPEGRWEVLRVTVQCYLQMQPRIGDSAEPPGLQEGSPVLHSTPEREEKDSPCHPHRMHFLNEGLGDTVRGSRWRHTLPWATQVRGHANNSLASGLLS